MYFSVNVVLLNMKTFHLKKEKYKAIYNCLEVHLFQHEGGMMQKVSMKYKDRYEWIVEK